VQKRPRPLFFSLALTASKTICWTPKLRAKINSRAELDAAVVAAGPI